jgi:hypothetical protein
MANQSDAPSRMGPEVVNQFDPRSSRYLSANLTSAR